jgi:hypothetical protein
MSDLLSCWPYRFLLALRDLSLNTFGGGGVFTERIRNFAEPTDRIPENSRHGSLNTRRTVRVPNTSRRAVDAVFAFALAAAWIFFALMFLVMLADVFVIVRGG